MEPFAPIPLRRASMTLGRKIGREMFLIAIKLSKLSMALLIAVIGFIPFTFLGFFLASEHGYLPLCE